jgi:[acyl-carrier-protein] S-malonyltransferase
MAGAWSARDPRVQVTLAEAGEVLGCDLAGLIADGPQAELDDTYNQQPAILAASVAILRSARSAGLLPEPLLVAGHSLGEFSALVAAASLEFRAALRLVRERGRLMRAAGTVAGGRMVAVLGLDDDVVVDTVARFPGAQVANFNAPGQVVISGAAAAVEAASAALADAGAKRLVPLPITIAAHSALMAPAAADFATAVADTALIPPRMPVVVNRTGEPVEDVVELRQALAGQLTSPVHWTGSVERMLAEGVTTFYEVGPGGVLTGLARRIARARGRDDITFVNLAEPPA